MSIGGVFLRFGSFGLRLLQFLCAALGVSIFSYFIAELVNHNAGVSGTTKAVEGLTGAATIYTLFAVLFTLCLGGNAFFGYLAVILDLLFMGAFIAVAVLTRNGAHSCSGVVNTPLGTGNVGQTALASTSSWVPQYGTACKLNTAVFAVSIIAAVLFLISAIWEVLMVRHHKKEKRYGPGPENNYTEGSTKTSFWKRNQRNHGVKEVEAGAIGIGGMRRSHETSTTLGNNNYVPEPKYGEEGYGNVPVVSGYGNAPINNSYANAPIHNSYANAPVANNIETTAGAPIHANHHLYYDTAAPERV
ncbi:hypothetical protein LTR66_016294 [Elasticomyces elasticus]|nr:hypothetical protein LTR66_016294 [Elasticomyces elasticus]